MSWEAVLEAADVAMVPTTPSEVVLELSSGARQQVRLIRSSVTVHPATMRRAGAVEGVGEPSRLWVAPAASPAAIELARRLGDSVVTSAGQVLLQIGGEVVELGRPMPPRAARRPGPPRWGALAVARRMLEVDVDRQQDLALLCGLSQERVSRILSRLRADGLTTRHPRASGRPVERPASRQVLLDWLLANYPRGEALRGHYFAADPAAAQLERAAQALSLRRPLLSGDLAADHLAPWRRPGHVLLYCARPVDLAEAGFVAAHPGQATLTLVTTPDPTVGMPHLGTSPWATVPAGNEAVELADPVQVLVDLLASTAPDAPEAVERLRHELMSGPLQQRVGVWLTSVIERRGEQQSFDPAPRPGGPAVSLT